MNQSFTHSCLLIIVFSAFAINAVAHTGSIKGIIKDDSTSTPLEGVSVFIEDAKQSAVTDAFGAFFIKGIHQGSYVITVSHLGYSTDEQKVKIEDGVTTEFNLRLKPSGINLTSVTVNARKDLAQNYISGLDLKLRPVNSTQDLMRLVPGLFTSQHQGGGKAEQIFLRGFDADHGTDVNVSVDDMPVNMVSHAHGQGFADAHFVIPELVREVDYGKGTYSMDKGNLATAGWVGFKTRESLDNSFVKLEGGMYGYARTVVGLDLIDRNNGNGKQSAYVAGEYGYNRSYFDEPQDFNRLNLVGKYTNYISDNKKLTVTLSGFHSFWNASGQIPTRAIVDGLVDRYGNLDGEGGATDRYNLNLQYFQSINDNSYFKSNIYLSYYDFELYSDFTFFLNDSVNGDQIKQAEQRIMGGYNNEYTTNYTLWGLKMKTQAGLGIKYDDVMNNELSHTIDKSILINNIALGDINEVNVYGYVNQTVYLTPQLVLSGGSRYDYFAQEYIDKKIGDNKAGYTFNKGAFSPKASLYYNISDKARIYYSYGTGFHSNDTRTLAIGTIKYSQNSADPISQSDLRDHLLPMAHSMDLGFVAKPWSKLLLAVGVWKLDLQQEFTYGGDESVVEPSGRTSRRGIDVSLRYELLKWLYIDGDVNLTKARYVDVPDGENYVPLAAGFTSIGGVTLKLNKAISASLRYRYMGDRPAVEDNSLIAKGYTVCDAVVNYVHRKYEFGLQIQNLFNVQWNEAQFATETRLKLANGTLENRPSTDICFTPGVPFFIKLSAMYKF